MRTLPTTHTQQIETAVQSPVFLVELYLPQGALFFSTGDSVFWSGRQYNASGVKVSNLASGQGASKQVTITINNNQFTWSALVLQQNPSGSVVRVYKLLGTAPYDLEDAYLVFQGEINDIPDLVNFVTFNCTTCNPQALSIPNITIGPPYFNFMPAAGQVIQWGGTTYTLDPR